MRLNRRNLLIGCGLLLVVGTCVAVTATIGGVGALLAIFGPDPEGLTVEVAVEPSPVRIGDTFQLTVSAGNEGPDPLTISEIALPQTLLDAALLTDVSPPDQGRFQSGDSTALDFNLTVPAGERADVIFAFRALSAGDFSGDLDVAVGVRRKITPLRVVVVAPDETAVTAAPQTDVPAEAADIPFLAVVQIIAMVEEDGQLYEGWTGSGSIISPDGLILTNAHVVLPDKNFPVDALVVALTQRDDQPPTPQYYAEVLQADEALDIAVLRVTADLDGNPLDGASLSLPSVPLGDSDTLQLGEPLLILGYPGIGGETITLTRGEVSGFTAEADRGERAFIKTSATIAGGNSGGTAVNTGGQLIGVPTQLGYGGEDQYVDCRVLADTNRDGFIDDNDGCVPTGGFINALRPIKLALPYIEAARRGEVAIHRIPVEQQEIASGGAILYQDDFSDPASGWFVANEPDYSAGYTNGAYEIAIVPENFFVWSSSGQSFGDALITVTAFPSGPTGEGDLGVICRYQDGDNYYALEVSEDGYFTIWKYESGKYFSLVDWELAQSLPADGSALTINAACVGDTLILAANGVTLAEVTDGAFTEGEVGLIAGTFETGNLAVTFDDFMVHAP